MVQPSRAPRVPRPREKHADMYQGGRWFVTAARQLYNRPQEQYNQTLTSIITPAVATAAAIAVVIAMQSVKRLR